jgi:hypothetical protein
LIRDCNFIGKEFKETASEHVSEDI